MYNAVNPLQRLPLDEVARKLVAGERMRSPTDDLVKSWTDFLLRFDLQWFCTMTFRTGTHPEAADKKWRLWISILNRKIYGRNWYKKPAARVFWIRALEWQRRDVLHYHALVGDCIDLNTVVRRLEMMDKWDDLAGFARIEPIEDESAVNAYVSKYVAKGGQVDLSESLRWYLQPKIGVLES